MAATNTVKTTDLTAVREVDFVTRFTREISIMTAILGSIRREKHEPGTKLTTKSAVVTLNPNTVGEGETIPYDKVTYTETEIGTLTWDKQAIGVTLEAISKHGYQAAVQQADDDLIYRLRSKLANNFLTFAQTGTLKPDVKITTFQMALAETQGLVQTKWEDMDKGYSEIIGFCNTLDAYRYLGAANITTQTAFGMTYLENFLGFSRLFMTSKIPAGTVISTPAENIILYYADATDNDFEQAGFEFRTDGNENLIAVHVEGNHTTMVSELTAVTGLGLYAEFLDGICVVKIGEDPVPSVTLDKNNVNIAVSGETTLTATTNPAGETVTWTSSDDTVATVSDGTVTGVTAGTATITATITVDSTDYTATCAVTVSGT